MDRSDPISSSELYAQLMRIEHHTSHHATCPPGGLAMASSHGRGYSSGCTVVELIVLTTMVIHLVVASPTAIPSTHAPPTVAPLTHSARSSSRYGTLLIIVGTGLRRTTCPGHALLLLLLKQRTGQVWTLLVLVHPLFPHPPTTFL
jgi:hypothetical protein